MPAFQRQRPSAPPPVPPINATPDFHVNLEGLLLFPFLLLPFLLLLRAIATKPRGNPEDSATPPCTPESEAEPEQEALPPHIHKLAKRVTWSIDAFAFASLPHQALALLIRLLPGDVVALATAGKGVRRATLRAILELTISGRGGDDAQGEEGTGLLPLLAQLSPDALMAIRVKRAGVATTAFLDGLYEAPEMVPCLYGPNLRVLALNLAGCGCSETVELLHRLGGGGGDDGTAGPTEPLLPMPRLTQLLLRNVPTGVDDHDDDDGDEDEDEEEGVDAGGIIGPALAAMIERRANRGAAPLERLAGHWRVDAASLARILRVTLPSLRWLEIGGGVCVCGNDISLLPPSPNLPPVPTQPKTHPGSSHHVAAVSTLADMLTGPRTRHRPAAASLTSLSISASPAAGMARAVANLLRAVAGGVTPSLTSLTLQGPPEPKVWAALEAVLAAPTQHELRSLTVMDCRRASKDADEAEADARWRGALERLAAAAATGGEHGVVAPRALRVKIVTAGRTYSLLVPVGAAGAEGADGGGGGRRSSMGRRMS